MAAHDALAGGPALTTDLVSLPFGAEEHSPLSRIIHRGIREAILNGPLQPGQILRQEELARRFRASRAPVR